MIKPYYQDSFTTIYHGDCLNILAGLPDLCSDIILSDMPYGTTNCRWDSPIKLERLWPLIHRVCSGAVILFAQTPFDKVLGVSNLSELRYEWIWEKTSATGHLNSKKAPMKAHENILVFSPKPPKYFPVIGRGHTRKTALKKSVDASEVYGKQSTGHFYDSTDRYPRDVLRFSSDKQRVNLHPTQKPLALIRYLIRTYTQTGEMVLDPFMGSGTTLVAAKSMQRKCIGIEREEEYCKIAVSRLQQEPLPLKEAV